MTKHKPNIPSFGALMPQEEMLEVKKNFKSLYIGIPKEISYQENRISLSPDAVAVLVSNGHKIVIEKGAGENANFSDEDYSNSGATIAYNIEDVYKAHIILKIEPPTKEEIKMHLMKCLFLKKNDKIQIHNFDFAFEDYKTFINIYITNPLSRISKKTNVIFINNRLV